VIPDDVSFISAQTAELLKGIEPRVLRYGEKVADTWINERYQNQTIVRRDKTWLLISQPHLLMKLHQGTFGR
jgi:hypothetical protein